MLSAPFSRNRVTLNFRSQNSLLLFCTLQLFLSLQLSLPAGDVEWLPEVTRHPRNSSSNTTQVLEPLMQDPQGNAIDSLEKWEVQRDRIKQLWLEFLGPMPDPRPKISLQILQEQRTSFIVRQLVRYEGEPGLFVEGYLLLPETYTEMGEKLPAIVALHQTTDSTIDEIAGVSGPDAMQIGWKLAQRGFVVFCPRCFLWQDAASLDEAVVLHRKRHPQTTGMAKMLYDAMRGTDLLVSLPGVDPSRIGAVGHSLGGKEVLYLAAFDERIKAAVASEGGLDLTSTNWEASWYLGSSIREQGFPLNHHQILALIAPRPFLIVGGESGPGAADGERSWPLIDAASPVWKLSGEPVRLGLFNHRQGHTISPTTFNRMADWLKIYLTP